MTCFYLSESECIWPTLLREKLKFIVYIKLSNLFFPYICNIQKMRSTVVKDIKRIKLKINAKKLSKFSVVIGRTTITFLLQSSGPGTCELLHSIKKG